MARHGNNVLLLSTDLDRDLCIGQLYDTFTSWTDLHDTINPTFGLENDGPRTQMHAGRHWILVNRKFVTVSQPVRNRFAADSLIRNQYPN